MEFLFNFVFDDLHSVHMPVAAFRRRPGEVNTAP